MLSNADDILSRLVVIITNNHLSICFNYNRPTELLTIRHGFYDLPLVDAILDCTHTHTHTAKKITHHLHTC